MKVLAVVNVFINQIAKKNYFNIGIEHNF